MQSSLVALRCCSPHYYTHRVARTRRTAPACRPFTHVSRQIETPSLGRRLRMTPYRAGEPRSRFRTVGQTDDVVIRHLISPRVFTTGTGCRTPLRVARQVVSNPSTISHCHHPRNTIDRMTSALVSESTIAPRVRIEALIARPDQLSSRRVAHASVDASLILGDGNLRVVESCCRGRLDLAPRSVDSKDGQLVLLRQTCRGD